MNWNPYLGGETEENLRRRGPRWDDDRDPDILREDRDDREEFEKDQLLGED
jgi:hypothetical protein